MTASLSSVHSAHFRDLPRDPVRSYPTIWGLGPIELHDRFWASKGVCVVRAGEQAEISPDAELYLLTDTRTLALFRLAPLVELLSWVKPGVLFLRLANKRAQEYRETVVTDPHGRFRRFCRLYGGTLPTQARLALTRERGIAAAWQSADDTSMAWRRLRRESRAARRETATVFGRAYDRTTDNEVAAFASDLAGVWNCPSATVSNISRVTPGVWKHDQTEVNADVRCFGQVWIGAGRNLDAGTTVLGPAVLWDDPRSRPMAGKVQWTALEPVQSAVIRPQQQRQGRASSSAPFGKRLFDFLFALVALLVTLPLYPLVILAIWIEDGRPFFFAHRRQTKGGREFPCIKFRSMRKDADRIKAELAKANQADGPQFFVAKDPRMTRVGGLIRRLNIDELPQFINVLLGHMSVVGPRPSPRAENQFSPAWREARLSVRAGITGLWQVRRTRKPGLDFQEWIKYDMEYVQNASWRLDLKIIFQTIRLLTRG